MTKTEIRKICREFDKYTINLEKMLSEKFVLENFDLEKLALEKFGVRESTLEKVT